MDQAHVLPRESRGRVDAIDAVEKELHVFFLRLAGVGIAVVREMEGAHEGYVAPGGDAQKGPSPHETESYGFRQRPRHQVHRLRGVEQRLARSSHLFEQPIDGRPRGVDHHSSPDLESARAAVAPVRQRRARVAPGRGVGGGWELRAYLVEAQPVDKPGTWLPLGESPGVTRGFCLKDAGLRWASSVRITDKSGRTRDSRLRPTPTPGVSIRGVGLWKVGRVGLEGGIEHVERNFPRIYGLGSNPNRWKVTAQAAVAF